MTAKGLTLGAVLTAITIAIEVTAAYGGEALIFITILSTLPIYMACRLHPAAGAISYSAVTILLLFISPHQCVFFAMTNGLLGLSLGITNHYLKWKIMAIGISGAVLAGGLALLLFAFNIPALMFPLPKDVWIIILILLGFSLGYASLYQLLAAFLYKRVGKWTGWI